VRAAARTARTARGERGIALVMVVVVLVALAIIATPFALSMRGMESTALHSFQQEAARADARLALAAAEHHLEGTHPFLDDETPWSDTADEIAPPDLAARHPRLLPRDPHGVVASVSIADESGKVRLGTASPFLLGNLLGGRATLAEGVDERATRLPIAEGRGWPATGLAWVGRELVEYSALLPDALDECRRGMPSANLAGSTALPHVAGDDVLDARLLLLAEHGWRVRPGTFELFRRVDGLKEIGLFGELTYTADDLDRVRPWLTVAGGAPAWRDRQPIRGTATARDGGVELLVDDGSRCGQGTIVELRDGAGQIEWNLVLSAADWGDGWRLELLEPPALAHDDGRSELRTLVRDPVNVCDCAPAVLEALITGLGRNPVADVINEREAALMAAILLAIDLSTDASVMRPAFAGPLERGEVGPLDLVAAGLLIEAEKLQPGQVDEPELAARLAGLAARRPTQRIASETARELARRIRQAQPGSPEALRHVLDVALQDGALDSDQRDLVLRNAADSNDAELCGGTAPFTYGSAGYFELQASVSRNLANGREQARAHVAEVVSVAPSGESARTIDTQRGFEELRPLGSGWASFPALLASGPGRAVAGPPDEGGSATLESLAPAGGGETPGDLAAALQLSPVAPSRAGTLVGGRPGASTSRDESYVAPQPVRSGLPDTLHFDEGAPGLTGSSPRGFRFADGSVTLPLSGLEPDLDGAGSTLLDAFTVEFWFELADPDAETILLDGAAGELEDRVLLAMRHRELILRVDDTGIPDFEAVMPEGHAPPGGEIRYAFDDGLALLPGVPYHVAAQIGGARDSQLALFVDGVPRGRRSFTTSLVEDVPANSGQIQGVSGYGQELKLRVESTAGFPERGALRIGQEVVEYVQKQPDAFLVRPGGPGDPFGGRGRRETVPLDHPASELVELVGWTKPLGSERAARGQVLLSSPLGEFGLAELDPTVLTQQISIEVTPLTGGAPFEQPLGTGLTADATEIPLRASGGLPLDPDTFQKTGGWAVIFCDYGGDALVGQSANFSPPVGTGSVQVTLVAQTKGGWLGGAECVRYQGFDGTRLTGVQRNAAGIPAAAGGPPSDLTTTSAVVSVSTGSTSWNEPREYITTFDAQVLGSIPGLPANPRVLVFPISVGASSGSLFDDFHPMPKRPAGAKSVLVQIGQDFTEGDDSTEWVRWDTATTSGFVRDDAEAINAALSHLVDIEAWTPDTPLDDDVRKTINDELDFRGQDGTPDVHHGSDDPSGRVLPVHVLGNTLFVPGFDPVSGLPGRHDAVTLVDPSTSLKEWHRVNWASHDDLDWAGYALVGLRDRVSGEFLRYDQRGEGELPYDLSDKLLDREFAQDDSSGRRQLELLNVDPRQVTRMICKPSGELPMGPIDAFRLGADWSGRRSPGQATVDELRFHRAQVPSRLLPNSARYVLWEDFELEEERELTLGVDALQYSYALRQNPILGPDVLGVLGALPQAGGLLRVGEEIVGYAGLDPVASGHVFLVARGLYGTTRAFHRRGEPVSPLLFWPVAPLAGPLSDTGAAIALADDSAGFPPGGGLLLIGEELVGYTRGVGTELTMPVRPGGRGFDSQGLLRGRFGSRVESHPAGTLARWFPARVEDRALLGSDVPESQRLELPLRAPGAFWTDLVVDAFLPLPGTGLEVRAVLDGRASPHADAVSSPGLLAAGARGTGETATRIQLPVRKQADRLDLSLFAVWEPGAFDGRRYASNAWKVAPEVEAVVAGHLQPTLVLEHEEWP